MIFSCSGGSDDGGSNSGTGGSDIDGNDDGVLDTNTTNIGSLHMVTTGSRLKQGYFNVKTFTEIIFQKIHSPHNKAAENWHVIKIHCKNYDLMELLMLSFS